MKLNAKFLTATMLTTAIFASVAASPANAGGVFSYKGEKYCVGFCGDDYELPDFIPEPIKIEVEREWKNAGGALTSAANVCDQVGLRKCVEPPFINTFQALRAGKMAGLYHRKSDCVEAGRLISKYGHEGVQAIMEANEGVPVPSGLMNFSQQMFADDIADACQVLFQG